VNRSLLLLRHRFGARNTSIATLVARRLDGRYSLMRYEDLMSDPERALDGIFELVGRPTDNLPVSGHSVALGSTHRLWQSGPFFHRRGCVLTSVGSTR
jgi:hypothetical protein